MRAPVLGVSMNRPPLSGGPSGRDLLSWTTEAEAYCRRLAPVVFPDGLPDHATLDLVRLAVWATVCAQPEPGLLGALAHAQQDEVGRRIGDAFRVGGLMAAFAEAAAARLASPMPSPGADPPRPRVRSVREISGGH